MAPATPQPSLTAHEAQVIDAFKRRPVLRMIKLCSSLRLSRMTVFRALAKHGYFRSFNHSAHFYTLSHTPQFDSNGLWFYRSIGFSRHRTLIQTVLALVVDAPKGFTVEELADLLHTSVGNLLASLVRQQQLARRRLGRRVVYLACDPQRQEQQWRHRQQDVAPPATANALPDALSPTAILPLLAELIRSPEDSIDQLAHSLGRQGVLLDPPDVQAILAFYHLEKKEAR